jgi:hypothetical protein
MKKISFIAMMGIFSLMATSCNKETEIIDKTEYSVIILVEEYEYVNSTGKSKYTPLSGVTIKFPDYPDRTYTTGADGKVTFSIQQGSYRITSEKSGYEYYNYYSSSEYETLSVHGNEFKQITLQEED